jgi:alcohol dehydrogenase
LIRDYNFQLHTHLSHGIGFSRNLDQFLDSKGYRFIVLMVDEGVASTSEYYQEIEQSLKKKFSNLTTIELRGNQEPDYDYLDEITDQVRQMKQVDAIVGLGGGSTLDIAKAVAALRNNPGKPIDFRGFDLLKKPGVPTIIIPTTAGTGAEATFNASFIDKKEMRKLGINGDFMFATHAILDAEWTLSCPKHVALSAGMDAVVHALESFAAKQSNQVTRMFSKEAFHLLYSNLPTLIDEPKNKDKRQNLILGSYLAGIAVFNSAGSGIASGLSYPIGVHYNVPHGIGGGMFMASAVAYNVAQGYQGYAELTDLIEGHTQKGEAEKSGRFADKIQTLSTKLEFPKTLNQWGINRDNIEEVARLMVPFQPAFDQNPVSFTAPDDALSMLGNHVE